MLRRILISLALIRGIVLAICNGTELSSIEAKARIFLSHTSYKMFRFYDENANNEYPDLRTDVPYISQLANRNNSIFLKKILEDSRKFDFKNFKDEELKYAFQILATESGEKIFEAKILTELIFSLDELENLIRADIIEEYNGEEANVLAYSPDIENIIRTSNDSEKIQYYWTSWKEIMGRWADTNLNTIIMALKDAADLSEMSPMEFWLRGFNISHMENLMDEIKPLYQELHTFVRNLIQKKYGESIIPSDGLIPDHLFTQFLLQFMRNESPIEEVFPYECLPPIEDVLMERFNSKKLYRIADNFFEKLGFETYPECFWGDRIRLSKSYDCQARAWYWTPNIYLEFCEKMNFWDFLDAYANMARIYYAKEMICLPAYFFKAPNSLDNAIGKAVVLSSSTHHNLKAIGMIPYAFNITQEVETNRLLRMAIRRLMKVPLNLVHAKVMAFLLSGNVQPMEVNNYYWQLMELYAGIGPPNNYVSDTYDLPKNFYDEMNDNYMSSEFTTEILSYQIHKKLCELSWKYPKQHLHLCDIYGSKIAGNALKKMMRLGTSKPFYKVLASMFPENPAVRAEGILEYYEPLKKSLVEMNKQSNVKPGWNISVSE